MHSISRVAARAIVPIATLLTACGGGESAAPPPPAVAAPERPPPPAVAAPPAPSASSEPTVLSEEQKRRDAARVPLASSIIDAYPNWGGLFSSLVATYSPDGKRIIFGSLRDGSPQIYAADVARPADPPKALSGGPERALSAVFTRDGKSVLFLRDTGADENFAIWRVNVDGTGLTNLTPGESLHRQDVLLPRRKPQIMIYGAKKVSELTTNVFSQSIDGGEPKVLYTHPRPGYATDAAPDASRALFIEYLSLSDSVLSEIDLAAGKARRVYPPEGRKGNVFSAMYSADGKRILMATDEGSESSLLLALDAASGKELARYTNASPKGAMMQAAVSPKGDTLAVRVDAGDHGEVRILDAKSLKLLRAVKVPLGQVELGSFREDGRRFSIMISLPSQPPNVFEVDVAAGSVHPLRDEKHAGLDRMPPVQASITSIAAFDGLKIPVNVYLPAERANAEKRKLPTVAIFHGGPAASYPVRWSPVNRFLVALGYAVIEPNVRGSTGFGRAYEMGDNREKRADWLKDLETVNAWAKAQPWCDGERVVVWGGSYGGYTTLMALTRQPTLWRLGVDLFGVADLKAFLRTTSTEIRTAFVDEFGDLEKDSTLLEQFSPMRDVDKIVSPLFVYAGQNDPRVPRSESDAIVRALRTRRIPVEYMVAANEGHSLDRRETKVELFTRVARFLEDNLKTKP
ncbi:prolyl oligopeptidase family serine peptidase [Pendulispora rubella]|uniref:Prolyl oligopeptidase family serine peptidase n=1 Tax=Pendulispora rubella TaxID=2741070 RepID=A0ABZ2L7S7_9BACT